MCISALRRGQHSFDRIVWHGAFNRRLCRCVGVWCAVALVFAAAAYAQEILVSSKWDENLPQMELENVRIKADSLAEAWKAMGANYLLRTVLFYSLEPVPQQPFSFRAANCRAREVFDALASAYGFTWTQDSRTGVIWFHPATYAYTDIAPTELVVDADERALPMQTGILEAIRDPRPEPTGLNVDVKLGGTAFTHTFNCPVDVPAGTYTVRDLLNTCCAAQISRTFGVSLQELPDRIRTYLGPVHLPEDRRSTPPAGALEFWKTEIGPLEKGPPKDRQIMARLADPSPRVRWATCAYADANSFSLDLFDWVCDVYISGEEALWVALGVSRVTVPMGEAGPNEYVTRFKYEATEELLLTGDPAVAILSAMEYARLSGDTSKIEIVSRRGLTPEDVPEIASEAARIIRASETVWQALQAKSTKIALRTSEWAGDLLDRPWPESQKLHFRVKAK